MLNQAQSDGTDRTRIRDGELLDIESGAELQVKSGGAIEVQSGGEIDVESGGALKLAGTAIAATAAEINQACDLSARSPVVITDEASHDLTATNSGRLHVVPDMSQNSSINLPTPAAGLDFEFMYGGGADDAHDHAFDTGSDTNFIIGGVAFADTDAGDAADEINAGVYSDNDSNSIFNVLNISAGTRIRFVCDGTNWYLTGIVFSDTIPTFADQS